MTKLKNKDKSLARESFIKILYQYYLSNDKLEMIIDGFKENRTFDRIYLDNLILLFKSHNKILINIIEETANIKIDELVIIDKCILILSVMEMLYISDLPKKVIINESILLAKKYSSDDAYKFINKILDKTHTYENKK